MCSITSTIQGLGLVLLTTPVFRTWCTIWRCDAPLESTTPIRSTSRTVKRRCRLHGDSAGDLARNDSSPVCLAPLPRNCRRGVDGNVVPVRRGHDVCQLPGTDGEHPA